MPKTINSVQYAAQIAGGANFSTRIDDKRQLMGSIQFATLKVVMDGTNVALDIITLMQLPPGTIVYPELCKIIVTDDLTSGALTINVGDVISPTRYCVGANCAAPGPVDFIAAGATVFPAGLGTRTPTVRSGSPALDTSLVTCTFATLGAIAEAGEFYVVLAYKCL